jgi:hypothetical protein
VSATPISRSIERKRTATDFTWSPTKTIIAEPPKQETKQPVAPPPKPMPDIIGECSAWLEESRNRDIALKAPPWPMGTYVEAFITEAVARREDEMVKHYLANSHLGLREAEFRTLCHVQLTDRTRANLQKR